ncbi:uncharacterized protein LTR77_005243 [Saxophila tyrrhenica]|uniref:DUF6590 domain-containing protein n=1 Tax=Saxophila tyrrhenica TaxID=1690608 RepID=A0AAV9PBA8_9PEZI|nr:hypothetical protein LTR77_005243 [Saxophila tyrrhenica]
MAFGSNWRYDTAGRQRVVDPRSVDPRPTGQAFAATGRDSKTGLETRWEFGASSSYTEPAGTTQRQLNVKRIREGPGPGRTETSIAPNCKKYMVIEALLVPPADTSTMSNLTLANDPVPDSSIRRRRFVIVRDQMEDRNSFEAIAIKTYNGEGVAADGVVKFHHAIIYTGDEPEPEPDELPRRPGNGKMEQPMQAQAIRVEQFDRTRALNPMSRLDYGSRYVFDHGVPNIIILGRIHVYSRASLHAQFNHVWAQIREAHRPSHAAQQVSSAASNADSTTTITPATRAGPSLASPDSGPITDEELVSLLRNYHNHAHQHGLSMPPQQLNPQQIQGLAANAHARAAYLQCIRQSWTMKDEEEDSSSDSEAVTDGQRKFDHVRPRASVSPSIPSGRTSEAKRHWQHGPLQNHKSKGVTGNGDGSARSASSHLTERRSNKQTTALEKETGDSLFSERARSSRHPASEGVGDEHGGSFRMDQAARVVATNQNRLQSNTDELVNDSVYTSEPSVWSRPDHNTSYAVTSISSGSQIRETDPKTAGGNDSGATRLRTGVTPPAAQHEHARSSQVVTFKEPDKGTVEAASVGSNFSATTSQNFAAQFAGIVADDLRESMSNGPGASLFPQQPLADITRLLHDYACLKATTTSSSVERKAVKFVKRLRGHILRMMGGFLQGTNLEILVPDEDTARPSILQHLNGNVQTADEKARAWLNNPDDAEIPSEDRNIMKGLDDLDALEDESEVGQAKRFLCECPEFDWLIRRIRSLASVDGERKSLISVEAAFFALCGESADSMGLMYHPMKLRIEWNPKTYLAQQYGTAADLGSTLVLVGDGKACCVMRCGDYLDMLWPYVGRAVLEWVQRAAESEDRVYETVHEHAMIRLDCNSANLLVSVSGPRVIQYESLDILAWLATACRASKHTEQIAGCVPDVSIGEHKSFGLIIGFKEVFELGQPEEETTEDPASGCWRRFFQTASIAMGYPIPVRNQDEKGLEVPFHLLPILSGAYWLAQYNGRTLLKGYNSMLVPIKRAGNSVQWHFSVNTDRSKLCYSEVEKYTGLCGEDESSLSPCRHFVGWAPTVVVAAGKSSLLVALDLAYELCRFSIWTVQEHWYEPSRSSEQGA